MRVFSFDDTNTIARPAHCITPWDAQIFLGNQIKAVVFFIYAIRSIEMKARRETIVMKAGKFARQRSARFATTVRRMK